MRAALRRTFDWTFRSRTTGEVVVAQWPNVPLVIFFVATAVGRLADVSAAAWVATIALLWWAADEMARGVNPFRRVLGLVVAALTLARVVLGWGR